MVEDGAGIMTEGCTSGDVGEGFEQRGDGGVDDAHRYAKQRRRAALGACTPTERDAPCGQHRPQDAGDDGGQPVGGLPRRGGLAAGGEQ